ncbi:MAG TPA: hypothetical protein VJB06_03835 [archaeon]|nr:hypothetical protein [archaeon]
MELKLSPEVEHRVAEASQTFGLKQTELVNQAILLYLDTIKKQVDLKREFSAWEKASDEAWENFEKSLWKKGKSG